MQDQDQSAAEYSSGAGCLTRLYWMFLGYVLLFVLLSYLIQQQPKTPSLLDAGYLLVLLSLIVVRYVDIRHFNGENGDNSAPATMNDWRKYAFFVMLGGVGVWLAIRLFVPLFWK